LDSSIEQVAARPYALAVTGTPQESAARRRARLWAIAFTVILMPSPANLVLAPDPNPFFTAAIRPSDLPLAALIGLSIPGLAGRVRRAGSVERLALALVGLVAVAVAVHPALQGLLVLGRLVGVLALALGISDLRRAEERRFLLVALGLTALAQTTLAIVQLWRGDILATGPQDPLIGPFTRPNGTLPFAYVLAGLALVGGAIIAAQLLRRPTRGRWAWAAVAAIALVPAGITFSRAAAGGLALGAAALVPGVIRRRPGHALALAAILAGGVLPALATRDGWTARNAESPAVGSAVNRLATVTQALPLIAADPVVGVGPGRTMVAIRDRAARVPGSITELNPPHDVPIAIALEAGVPAGLVALALLVALGLRALRRGTAALLAYGVLVPYLVIDNWPYTTGAGLVMLGLWAADWDDG
jgi:O-antigen ligase/polysaccharide polymerase Wzy-like membrane protein